jgi:hypothetical protein
VGVEPQKINFTSLVGNDTWTEYAERFHKNLGIKHNNLSKLYEVVNELENVELELKEFHSRGITDCLFLNLLRFLA